MWPDASDEDAAEDGALPDSGPGVSARCPSMFPGAHLRNVNLRKWEPHSRFRAFTNQ